MRKAISCTTILFFSIIAMGQKPKNDSPVIESRVATITKLSVDTLKVQTISEKQKVTPWYKDSNMPWIAAILIAILTVLTNINIAKRNFKLAQKNLEKQIHSSTEIANNQINANRETTLSQFKSTLNTNNRQAWVTDVRNVISDLLTQAKLLNIILQEVPLNIQDMKSLHEKVTYSHIKLLLLLDPNNERHKATLQTLGDFMNTLDKHLLSSQDKQRGTQYFPFDNSEFFKNQQRFIDEGRKLLYLEWAKIQTLT